MPEYPRGSEWRRWDLHVHTANSYDYDYIASDSDNVLCGKLRENNIALVAKKRRQITRVNINKLDNNKFTFKSGSLESEIIDDVVDVLEGIKNPLVFEKTNIFFKSNRKIYKRISYAKGDNL